MEPPRPQIGESRSSSHDSLRAGAPSPRIEHYDGEVPPALSPLDAFAAQGRLLARQLEESARKERRMSRLPPATVARSLSQPRPGYFRAPSSGDSPHGGRGLARYPTQRVQPEVEEPMFRPQSEHPRLSSVSHLACEYDQYSDHDATPTNEPMIPEAPYSEEPMEEPPLRSVPEPPRRFYAAAPVGVAMAGPPGTSPSDSASRLNVPRSLARPASPLLRPSSSSRAPQPESSDDDLAALRQGRCSQTRSPMSPTTRSHPRSPSLSSETSNNGTQLPRPSYNFSRPLSRSSTSLSAPAPTSWSEPVPITGSSTMSRVNKPGPILVPSQSDMASYSGEDPSPAVSSYIYAKYSLPRGRNVSRDSVVFSGLQTPHFEWQEPLFESPEQVKNVEPPKSVRIPSPPPSRQSSTASQKAHSMYDRPTSARQLLTPEAAPRSNYGPPSPKTAPPEPAPVEPPAPEAPTVDDKMETTSSADSASTVRPQTAKSTVTSAVITADEHVTKGIECHEKGSLKESTYHLRIAAKQNHPTGMLLYALACRHGWGMRPNQREGVQWLRKAVDSVGVELMDDGSATVPVRTRELQKAYRAQFALSIYELGVSHLNGWGIEQDKSLALRCFEIAGQWGDADALAEAGFCYAEGVGCKKDLKKAARLYRKAAEKGMNMVGNSWIYKDKYMSDDESNAQSRGRGRSRQGATPEKKQRSKSRTRSLFQRKKSVAAEA
ncbi:uncharacterized protein ATNIH1004_010352 [Aspergillus tanneri]|uniref:Cell cycle inhibitor Nif1 n=1 Tax=Aspergillus tanneri TaxID=1220188 RepID=A0A5M9MF25_9EURO|nr:uncharacterized protein ATNIH1004_010352 [Aspergillus tanneri]KAA8643583.1 hypothetical protein ATNIH1004_010352 [Aspergillus tanneri]